ncbi:MAG: hypothetical protein KJO77_02455 [Bacteroidia bacterium]|nr:hypothetical protein [Bacteroidia bacterium]NND53108.1 hypothetical protein [Flavobacteriaceae bacterium]
MSISRYKKPIILGILFFLPVTFLLFLYPSTHNYQSLDIVYDNVEDISPFLNDKEKEYAFQNNITVLTFLGEKPYEKAIQALNLKELIYDKFKGFKRFQVIALVANGSENEVKLLLRELYQYDELKYWHFVYGDADEIQSIYNSLLSTSALSHDLSTEEVFIIDKDLKQRGRIDDRTEPEIEKDAKVYGLYSYNCIEVAELKNKMSEDMRILFTEYRQKRKGNYDSSTRREENLKGDAKN